MAAEGEAGAAPQGEDDAKNFWVAAHLERELASDSPDPAKVSQVWLSLMGAGSGRPRSLDEGELHDMESFPQKRTIDVDVPRTRSDVPMFKTPATRELLTRVLVRFCRRTKISYKQGLNELLAPVLYLVVRCREEQARDDHLQREATRHRLRRMAEAVDEPVSPLGSPGVRSLKSTASTQSLRSLRSNGSFSDASVDSVEDGSREATVEEEVYALFEKFMRSFCLWFYNDPDFRVLQMCIHIFRLLLQYHDPSVARALESNHLTPELYAMPWCMTLFARGIDLEQVLVLWDWMVAEADPALWLYLGVALLLRHRDQTLTQDASLLPQTLSHYQLGSPENMHLLMAEALRIREGTPWTTRTQLKRILRHPAPPQRTLLDIEGVLTLHGCLAVSPRELIRSLNGGALSQLQRESQGGSDGEPGRDSLDTAGSLDYVVLDVRAQHVRDDSGAGFFAKSMALGQEVIHTDGFGVWLEHFDAVRGCHICVLGPDHVVDTAATLTEMDLRKKGVTDKRATDDRPSSGLWRRLLLGEGDGVDAEEWDGIRYGFGYDLSVSLGLPMEPGAAERSAEAGDALLDDGREWDGREIDPTMQLALCLIRRGFTNVSICLGGMFECVQEFRRHRIADESREPDDLEPLIIGYAPEQWQHWTSQRSHLHAKYHHYRDDKAKNEAKLRERTRAFNIDLALNSGEDFFEDEDSIAGSYVDDEVLRIRVAAAVAKEAGHQSVLPHLAVRLVDLIAAGEIPEGDDVSDLMVSPRKLRRLQQQKRQGTFNDDDNDLPWGTEAQSDAKSLRISRIATETASTHQHMSILPLLVRRYAQARLLDRYKKLTLKVMSPRREAKDAKEEDTKQSSWESGEGGGGGTAPSESN
mmetsp:Transcript_14378/g.43145  ORF Transcript_14378/g.43145 Transcript_14378/m.43145 type:complete len:868 (-) Transcript_14378:1042-3645(-)